jgi:hypothetical protein
MILSYKSCCVLLYDSLITYIGFYWVYAIAITLVGLCCLVLTSQEHWSEAGATKTLGSDNKVCYFFLPPS